VKLCFKHSAHSVPFTDIKTCFATAEKNATIPGDAGALKFGRHLSPVSHDFTREKQSYTVAVLIHAFEIWNEVFKGPKRQESVSALFQSINY
jgi:hypothetical protein